jgi:probable phosphoglycerate mutase
MTKITIIRHAEAEGNLYRRAHGWFNGRITPTGRLQIKRLEERTAHEIERSGRYDVLYSSDLGRAMETAGAVSRAAGIPIVPCPGLREINSGEWEDLPWGYLNLKYPDLVSSYTAYPEWRAGGGESTEQLCRRLADTLDGIVSANMGKSICIVSHAVAIKALFCRIYGIPPSGFLSTPSVSNASVSVYEYDGTSFTPIIVNDTSHISDIVQLKALLPEGIERRDTQLWFRSADIASDLPLVVEFWKNSWLAVHGDLSDFDMNAVKSEAARMLRANRDSVCFAKLVEAVKRAVLMSESECAGCDGYRVLEFDSRNADAHISHPRQPPQH